MPRDDFEPLDDDTFAEHNFLAESWSELHSHSAGSDWDLAVDLGEEAMEAYYNAFANEDLTHEEKLDALYEWFVDITGIYDEDDFWAMYEEK